MIQTGTVLENSNAPEWSPWRFVRVIDLGLFGDVKVEPMDKKEGEKKEHTFSKDEASRFLKEI